MGATEREEVALAFAVSMERVGPDLLDEPRRLRAMLSDLVGSPGRDHRAEVEAITLASRARRAPANADPVTSVLHDAANRRVDRALATWAVETIDALDTRTRRPSSPRARDGTRVSRPVLLLTGATLALVAAIVAFLGLVQPWDRGEGGDDAGASTEPTQATSSTDSATTTTELGPRPSESASVRFDPVQEGPFLVERTWTVDADRVDGEIVLTATTDTGVGSAHYEVLPRAISDDVGFVDPPDQSDGRVAAFSVALGEGDTRTIRFEGVAAAEPDEASIEGWIEAWLTERRAGLEEFRPLDPVVDPTYEVEGS